MCLVLEVGKVYLNKLGHEVKVVSDEAKTNEPFIGVVQHSGQVLTYKRDGTRLDELWGTKLDLFKLAPTPHPHAESMMLYAQDAAECEKPHLRWEKKHWGEESYQHCRNTPQWSKLFFYRRRPQSEWPPEAC